MSEYEPDSLDYTPERSLEEALKLVRTADSPEHDPRPPEERPPDKCLVIMLWDDNDQYSTRFYNAGMSLSQCIALCEIQKTRFLRMMHAEGDDTGN